jgi:hypothetical protein
MTSIFFSICRSLFFKKMHINSLEFLRIIYLNLIKFLMFATIEYLSSWMTYFIFLLIFLLLGYYILDNLIFESQEVKNWLPIMVFCINFALSLIYLELLIFEILQYGTEEYFIIYHLIAMINIRF